MPEYKKREYELYERIRQLSQELDQLSREKKDITHICRGLEAVLDEFELFRQECKGKNPGATFEQKNRAKRLFEESRWFYFTPSFFELALKRQFFSLVQKYRKIRVQA